MSRYQEWNKALNGMSKAMRGMGFKTTPFNRNIESEVISEYCKINKIEGIFSDKVLIVSKEFEKFKLFLAEKIEKVKQ